MSVAQPKYVPKGWGFELWIANNYLYCGKILHVDKGKRCSSHFHVKKLETFYIVKGSIIMRLIHKDGTKEEFVMNEGDVLDVPQGLMHQFEGISEDGADIIEVSTTHDDDDSYRVSKGD